MARARKTPNAVGGRLANAASALQKGAEPAAVETHAPVDDTADMPPEQRQLDPATMRGPGRPRKETTIREPGARHGLQPGQERFTVVGDAELLDRLRDYAYTERITLRAALDRAIREFLKSETGRGIEILHRPD